MIKAKETQPKVDVQVGVEKDLITVIIDGTTALEIETSGGNTVTLDTDAYVHKGVKPLVAPADSSYKPAHLKANATAVNEAAEGKKAAIGKHSALRQGLDVKVADDVKLSVTASGKITVKQNFGEAQEDQTVFVASLPDGKKLYAAPTDAMDEQGSKLAVDFKAAKKYVKHLNKIKYLGHKDWRVPTKEELELVYRSREKGALKGTFNTESSGHRADPNIWYISSTPTINRGLAWVQKFSCPYSNGYGRNGLSTLRPVR